jgi:hypothetical protein
MDEQFLFDDFFVGDDDPGIEIVIHVRGRDVPLHIRPLSTSDQVAVQAASVSKRFTPSGQVVIDRIDEAKANAMLIAKSIVSWPFVNKDGRPVAITAENCGKLIGDAGTQITAALGSLNEKKTEVITPFDSSSDAA